MEQNQLVMTSIFGSHLYGLETPESDKDYKGIYIPTTDQILRSKFKDTVNENTNNSNEKNTSEDVDLTYFSIHKFIDLACKGDTVAIDLLHTTTDKVTRGPYYYLFGELQNNRTKFYSKDMNSYMGYVRRQASKYGVKGSRFNTVKLVLEFLNDNKPYCLRLQDLWNDLPQLEYTEFSQNTFDDGSTKYFYEVCGRKLQSTLKIEEAINVINKIYENYGHRARAAMDNNNIDWKAVSHALRAGYQLRSIFIDGDFEYPLKESQFVLDVKQGKLDFTSQVQVELETLVEEVNELSSKSNLPENINTSYWDQWLIDRLETIYGIRD